MGVEITDCRLLGSKQPPGALPSSPCWVQLEPSLLLLVSCGPTAAPKPAHLSVAQHAVTSQPCTTQTEPFPKMLQIRSFAWAL